MKAKFRVCDPPNKAISKLLIVPISLFLIVLAWLTPVQADTSANATIYNEVTVQYTSGSATSTVSAFVNVTVATLAAAPTVTVDTTTQSVAAGETAPYVYTLRSNSNGPDIYTPAISTVVNAGVSAPGSNAFTPASIDLWGGIIVRADAGYIELPGGSLASAGLATGDVFALDIFGTTYLYEFASITAGNIAALGNIAEVYDRLYLTPLGTSPAIDASLSAGTQVGQVGTITLAQVAGTPTLLGTDGTHTTNLTFTTTAGDADGNPVTYPTSGGDSNQVVTTVSSPRLTIVKGSRNVVTDPVDTFVTDGSTTAKPGEKIEYQITVTNTHGSANVTAVSIVDAIPVYTALAADTYGSAEVQITTMIGGVAPGSTVTATSDSGDDVATLNVAGDTLIVNIGTGAGSSTPGILGPGDVVIIQFQVEVD